jgi:hypothetical protein
LDTEKALREEEDRRKDVEEKLFNAVLHSQNRLTTGDSSVSREQDLLALSNEELIRKGRTEKELRSKVDIYEGVGLET